MTNQHAAVQEPAREKAIIVGVALDQDASDRLQSDLDELELLLDTRGVICVGRVVQRRNRFDARCLLGVGKAEEIGRMVAENQAHLVVFVNPLAPPQVRNLEKVTGCDVRDRTWVILEIFSKHAKTSQAKIQVEIAQLEYMLPRLAGVWTHFGRQRGAVLARGMGEKQIEIDRRRARERISRLQKQLIQIRKERVVQRKARSDQLKVALVGYTNSGKTTLMKGLTKAQVEAKNELFATLDTNIKTIDPKTHPRILLADTVGFIQNLPHGLIESFKSTLEEVCDADLLLNVVDVSHPSYKDHIITTGEVLKEIGAGDIPMMMVFNKIDRLEENDQFLPRILKGAYRGSIAISGLREDEVLRLRQHIYDYFKHDLVENTVTVPLGNGALQSFIYQSCLILDVDYSIEDNAVFTLQATAPVMNKILSILRGGTEQS